MTGTNDKLRSLFLTMLMVLSVFAGSIAFSGAAAASANTAPGITDASEDQGEISIGFNGTVQADSNSDIDTVGTTSDISASDVEVYVKKAGTSDFDVYQASAGGVSFSETTTNPTGHASGTTSITLGSVGGASWGDLDPADTVYVNFTNEIVNATDQTADLTREFVNVSVDLSTHTLDEGQAAHNTRPTAQQVYQGSPVNFKTDSTNEGIFLRNVETGEIILDGSTGLNSQSITFQTDNLQSGATYQIIFDDATSISGADGTGTDVKYFNVTSLNLEAGLAQDGDTIAYDADVKLDVNASAVRGDAPIVVDTGDNTSTNRERLNGKANFDKTYNEGAASSIHPTTYTVTVTDVRTGITATAGTYTVEDFPTADSASLENKIVSEDRGDVAEITINLQNSEPGALATVQVGDLSDDAYVTNVTVADEDGDGQVVLNWNTYMAGVNVSERIFSVEGSDTVSRWGNETGEIVEEIQDFIDASDGVDGNGAGARPNYTYASNLSIDATQYDLKVVANGGDEPNTIQNFTNIDADDLGAVQLSSNGVDTSRVWVAPKGRNVDLGYIQDNLDNNVDDVDGNLTDSDSVASDEVIVQEIEARGIEGVLQNRTDFGESLERAFLNETASHLQWATSNRGVSGWDAGHTYDNDGFDAGATSRTGETAVWDIGYNQKAASVNRDPAQLIINQSTIDFISDPSNNTYYVVLDLDGVPNPEKLEPDTVFWANFSLSAQNSLSGQTPGGEGDTSDEWRFQEASATLQTNSDNEVIVRSAEDQTVRGSTTVAPGTLVSVRITSQSDNSPFLRTPTTRVTANRTLAVTEDFSDVGSGVNFTAVVRRSGTDISQEYDGRVKAQPRASVTFNDQEVAETQQEVVVASATLSDGGFIAIHEGSASGPVIGVSKYLSSGTSSNVRIDLDQEINDTTTLVAMPHLDDNSNNLYDFPGADAPYSVNGTIVTDGASVSVSMETPTPTPTPTPTEGGTPTPGETTTTSGGGPGFTMGIAVIALAAAALLAARRRD